MRKLLVSEWVSPIRGVVPALRRLLCAVLVSLVLAGCQGQLPPPALTGSGVLLVKLAGIRGDQGLVMVSLFGSQRGFPDEPAASLLTLSVPIHNGQAEALFPGIPYGEYALSVLHDENGDGEMATGLFGMPREGFGFSGRPDYRFGHPDFAKTRFWLMAPYREIEVMIRYETGQREHRESGASSNARRPVE